MSRRFQHSWTCPACGGAHSWSWPGYDTPQRGDKTFMECDHCGASTPMRWMGEAGWVVTEADSPNTLPKESAP